MLLIYLAALTPRTEYIFDLIFKTELGLDYTITTNRYAFDRYGQEKINYSSAKSEEGLFIMASTLLFERTIEKINIAVEKKHGTFILFPNDASCDIGFDIFAAVFYMVSRYEEYLPFKPDMHGRFPAEESLAYQNNFLQLPVVNIWIRYLKNKLNEKFPSLQFKTPSFKAIVTYDIDIAYAYKGRNFLRTAGATAKDILKLKPGNIIERIRTLTSKKDPWDIYDELEITIKENKLDTIFFFLLDDYSKYDKNIKYDHPLMKNLIRKVSEFSDIGIHPSYNSSVKTERILIEKNILESISGKQITKSRQHYLRFTLPGTYNKLIEAGITEDYSMGFTGIPGFRAGTCAPFYFYDLKNEKATKLKVFPVTFMEGTFIEYMKVSPSKALENINELLLNVKDVQGIFICIWHNNTVSNHGIYEGWKKVHDMMIQAITETKA